MTDVDAGLVDLAGRYGVATDYVDWTGRWAAVPESTLVAVLGALGVPASTPRERAAAVVSHDRAYWSKSLPPTDREPGRHRDHRSGCMSPTAIPRTSGCGSRTARVRSGVRQLDNFTPPYDLDGRLIGEATFALPADLPLGYHRVHLRSGDTRDQHRADRHAAPGWVCRRGSATAGPGAWPPSSTACGRRGHGASAI